MGSTGGGGGEGDMLMCAKKGTDIELDEIREAYYVLYINNIYIYIYIYAELYGS